MKVLKIEDGYRLFPPHQGKEYILNERLPLHWLVYRLSINRNYNKELTVEYIKRNYDIDLSEVIDSYDWTWNDVDIFKQYTTENPREDFMYSDRDYFQNKGKNYFYKFSNWCGYRQGRDDTCDLLKHSVVHHIHPLYAGGTNKLENLIKICDYNHDILHDNPMEKEEKYCHQAVNYLWYLYFPWASEKNEYFFSKYKIDQYAKFEHKKFVANVLMAGIRNEMMEFYQYIESDFGNMDNPSLNKLHNEVKG